MQSPFGRLREGYDELRGLTVELDRAVGDGSDAREVQSLVDDRGRLIGTLEDLLSEATRWAAHASPQELTRASTAIAESIVLVRAIQERDCALLISFESVQARLKSEGAKLQQGRRTLHHYRPGRTSDGHAMIDRRG